jgi:hypothetical protein
MRTTKAILTALLLAASLASATKVTAEARVTPVWRKNAIVSAFADGWLCCGLDKPRSVQCHRAVSQLIYKEISNSTN